MDQGICKNLCQDSKGVFCVVKAIEGFECRCGYGISDCHVVDFYGKPKIQCGGEKIGIPTLVGVCQDFDPEPWVHQQLFGVSEFSI
jgi:hypothetical protein